MSNEFLQNVASVNDNLISKIVMRTQAPAVFNRDPHVDCSSKYKVFSTWDAIQALAKKGWYPTDAMQVQARELEDRQVAKHLVRFRNDKLTIDKDNIPEIVLGNSHNRSHAWTLDGGVFRFVCSNGMIVCDEEFGRIRMRHMKHEMSDILEATEKFADHVGNLSRSVKTMKDIRLDKKDRTHFALEAQAVRYPNEKQFPFDSSFLLVPRRPADYEPTLWNTLNVIQENIMKGGIPYSRAVGTHTKGMTRAVRSVSENLRINKGVWDIAHNLMKAAA